MNIINNCQSVIYIFSNDKIFVFIYINSLLFLRTLNFSFTKPYSMKSFTTKSYVSLFFLFFINLNLTAQRQQWKVLREEGANFYDIEAAFQSQNDSLIRLMRAEAPHTEGGESNRFNSVIKYNRWAHFVKPRIAESNGDIGAMVAGNVRGLAARAAMPTPETGETWTPLSPASTPTDGGNGRVNVVRKHPTLANTYFACSPAGGLWKTTNGGTNWTPITDNIGVLGCSDLGFSPTNSNIMYLATGDGDASDTYSLGVYKSTDGGSTWQATGLTFTSGQKVVLSRLLVNPNDGSILVSGSNGIYRSVNEGNNWTRVSTLNTRDLKFKANDPSVVFATRYNPAGSPILLRSTDSGINWVQQSSNGLPTSSLSRAAIATTVADPNYIYIIVANNTNYGLVGVYRSTDGGTSFTQMTSSSPNLLGWEASGGDTGGQGYYDLALAVSQTDRNLIYSGGVNVWRSQNGGSSWTCVGHWNNQGAPYVHADIHDLFFEGSTVWAACDGGVFKLQNTSTNWEDKSANLRIAQIYSMGLSATNANKVVSGHQDNGTNLMTDANSWSEILGGDGMQCFIDRTNDNNIFASVYYGYLFRSTDGGANFTNFYDVPDAGWVTPWLQDPTNVNTLYAGGIQVYKSTNRGDTWTSISNFNEFSTIAAIEVARTNNQIMYVAKGTYVASSHAVAPYLYKTVNGGSTWTQINNASFPTSGTIIGLHIDVNNPNRILVGFASYLGNSVYVSNDGGNTWSNYSQGLPSVPANCFTTVVGDANGSTYVGTDVGIFYRNSNSTAWESFNNGIPSVIVSDLEIFYPTAKLRCATYGRGIWETPLPGYNALPSVSLIQPTEGQVFTAGTNITLSATAADTDGNIQRVEFYQNNVLIGRDSTAPYTLSWTNVLANEYRLTAKAYDDSLATATSTAVNISVLAANDASIVGIRNPTNPVSADSSVLRVVLKNFGSSTLNNVVIKSKLDNGTPYTYNWTGSLGSRQELEVLMPNILRYAIGNHNLTVWVESPNNTTDANLRNDTLNYGFEYVAFGACADNYEPNNSNSTATTIPINTIIRSKLATFGDQDYFTFTTTNAV